MPSPSAKIPVHARVRVFLCPEKDTGQPWLCPAGVGIQLTRKGRGTRATTMALAVGELGEQGVTRPVDLEEGPYEVRITDPRFTKWDPTLVTVTSRPALAEVIAVAETVEVAARAPVTEVAEAEAIAAAKAVEEAEARREAGELLDIMLAPQSGRRLVVVRLVTDSGEQIPDGTLTIAGPGPSEDFQACSDGNIYAAAAIGAVTFHFASVTVSGQLHCTQAAVVPYTVSTVTEVKPLEFIYWPAIQILANPTIVQSDGGKVALTGASVKVDYQASPQEVPYSRIKTLAQGAAPPADGGAPISFEYPFPGYYTATVTAPLTWQDLPIQPGPGPIQKQLQSGCSWEVPAEFTVAPTQEIAVQLQLPPNQQLTENADLEISYEGGSVPVTVRTGTNQVTATVPQGMPLTIGLAEGAVLMTADGPLELPALAQPVTSGTTSITPLPQHSITIKAVDEADQAVPGAMIDIFGPDDATSRLRTVITDHSGTWVATLPGQGTYYLSEHYEGAQAGMRQAVAVASNKDIMFRIRRGPAGGEALTDLSAYPVLTEEISTTGVPAPTGGAPGGGGPGAGYGQAVDQVMRDVLGWRPSGDVAGFQAALTGAFQLRQVEGHTEWTWQQRGYAVQADMGALTGAQASIYARAKNALDQIQPLLAGLTAINPALYPPQDLEAIRTVVAAELQELVSELAWEGGPRIQRVNELFVLLVGESRKSFDPNPDHVQGQLGILRDRFGLTEQWVDTVDEERIITNFRVVVEQVLSLQESWFYDRDLLAVVDSRSSLGTILTWLSRGLEAVCESVGDLSFALDSVYVDAAQRQVIELRLPGQPPLLLSDLLDWVLRASRDEGPRIIQDAGKDGVLAFAPVLDRLRTLIHAAREVARTSHRLPSGMRTPRVDRAFQVLASQLAEASRLAGLVRRDQAPRIDTAMVTDTGTVGGVKTIMVQLAGSNLRKGASAVLIPENHEELADLPARPLTVQPPGKATATFRDPRSVRGGAGVNWLVSFTNEDGEPSYPIALTLM
jgi:hypothetical protein